MEGKYEKAEENEECRIAKAESEGKPESNYNHETKSLKAQIGITQRRISFRGIMMPEN
jgi:hypothetical protein